MFLKIPGIDIHKFKVVFSGGLASYTLGSIPAETERRHIACRKLSGRSTSTVGLLSAANVAMREEALSDPIQFHLKLCTTSN